MKKILLIIYLLISTNAFSEEIKIKKIKANFVNNIIKVKVLIESPKSNKVYVSHIKANACGNIVYDMSTSKFLSKHNGYVQFSYFDIFKCEDIKLVVTDNLNNKKTKKVKVKDYLNSNAKEIFIVKPIKKLKYNSEIWKARTPKEAINIIYGNGNYIEDKIELILPSFSENLDRVQIQVKSNIKLKSIAIFDNSNPSSTLSIISVPSNGNMNYIFKYKLERICNIYITVVAQGIDGKLYKKIEKLNWGGGDIRCTGYNTITSNGGGG